MARRNPLLKLQPRRIRTLTFGEKSVLYGTSKGKFEVRFASRQDMELAVRGWSAQASERGEFFRVGSLKTLLKARRSRVVHASTPLPGDNSFDCDHGTS